MSTGFHARRATGLTGAEKEESFTRTESVARWSLEGGQRTKLRSSAVRLFFLPVQGVFFHLWFEVVYGIFRVDGVMAMVFVDDLFLSLTAWPYFTTFFVVPCRLRSRANQKFGSGFLRSRIFDSCFSSWNRSILNFP